MSNPYIAFYESQAGNGHSEFFSGTRFQRGRGIGSAIGSIFRNIMKAFRSDTGKYLTKKALGGLANIAGDTLVSGENFRESFKKRGKETAGEVIEDIKSKMSGSGYIRRRGRRKYKTPKTKKVKRRSKRTNSSRNRSDLLAQLEKRLR